MKYLSVTVILLLSAFPGLAQPGKSVDLKGFEGIWAVTPAVEGDGQNLFDGGLKGATFLCRGKQLATEGQRVEAEVTSESANERRD